MTIRRVEALQISEFLGSLLASVVDAQAESARATVDFIDDVGFEDTPEGDKLRTVSIRYRKRDENDELKDFEVTVPLLALVNVPSLAVSEAKLAFSYDVVSAEAKQPTSTESSPTTLTGSRRLNPAIIKGIAKKKTTAFGRADTKTTSAIDLDVTLEQQEVPIGIERLFDLAELGITEDPVTEDTP